MLKRIAVVGDDDNFLNTLRKSVEGKDVQLEAVQASSPLPLGTAGLIVAPEQAKHAVRLATAVGEAQKQMLSLLADAIDCREGIPAGSGERIREHASRFARVLKLDPGEQLALEIAAYLRAIGKTRISNDVLLKKSVLDYDEWLTLKQHTTLGAGLLDQMGMEKVMTDIVRFHQECYDGTGYPEGRHKDEIPYLARALKICVTYCAMTSPRHYRARTASHDDALQELRDERGKHFDPTLIDAFLEGEVAQPA
jgi:response regulator RpfG family c-di-GMP phosphodiesterase